MRRGTIANGCPAHQAEIESVYGHVYSGTTTVYVAGAAAGKLPPAEGPATRLARSERSSPHGEHGPIRNQGPVANRERVRVQTESSNVIDPAEHADSRNIVETILRYIPGFRGYLNKEYRRESDELARRHLADGLQRVKSLVDDHQRRLAEAVQLDALPDCERVRTRIDTLQSRIRGAVQGYSGFFDFVRVDEGVLDQVYEHDLSLTSEVKALTDAAQSLAAASDGTTAVRELLQLVEALHRSFDKRSEILEGLSAKA